MISTSDRLQDGFVLAGGASRRMGSEKALIEYRGRTLLDWSIHILNRAGLKVTVVADRRNRYPDCGVEVLADQLPGGGPLSGLHTALSACSGEFAFVLPCDMPLVNPRFFVELQSFPARWDIVIPIDDQSKSHFLCGRYSIRCQSAVLQLLEQGEYRVGGLCEAEGVRVNRIPVQDLGLSAEMLQNVNHPEDVEALP